SPSASPRAPARAAIRAEPPARSPRACGSRASTCTGGSSWAAAARPRRTSTPPGRDRGASPAAPGGPRRRTRAACRCRPARAPGRAGWGSPAQELSQRRTARAARVLDGVRGTLLAAGQVLQLVEQALLLTAPGLVEPAGPAVDLVGLGRLVLGLSPAHHFTFLLVRLRTPVVRRALSGKTESDSDSLCRYAAAGLRRILGNKARIGFGL